MGKISPVVRYGITAVGVGNLDTSLPLAGWDEDVSEESCGPSQNVSSQGKDLALRY